MNLNKVILSGRLTRDPELKALPGGGNVATFGLAINRSFKNRDGERTEQTEFVDIVTFGTTAELCSRYLTRGQIAIVEGRLQTRSWEKDGEKKYKTEVVADAVQFGPRPGGSAQDDDMDQRPPAERAPKAQKPAAPASGIEYPDEDINPEDIPF